MKMNTLLVFAVLGVLLVFSGCTQQGTPTTTTNTDTTQTTADNTSDNTGTPDVMDGSNNTPPGAEVETTPAPQAGVSIESFATASPPNGYKAEYSVTSQGAAGKVDSSIIMYGKHPQFRTDSIVATSNITVESRSYFTAGSNTSSTCSNLGGAWSCQTSTPDEAAPMGSQVINPDITFESNGTKVVVGETGTCFKGKRISDPNQTFNMCYTSDGILLYSKTTIGVGTTIEMTAKSVVRGIDDSVFALPA